MTSANQTLHVHELDDKRQPNLACPHPRLSRRMASSRATPAWRPRFHCGPALPGACRARVLLGPSRAAKRKGQILTVMVLPASPALSARTILAGECGERTACPPPESAKAAFGCRRSSALSDPTLLLSPVPVRLPVCALDTKLTFRSVL
jgi:hypothetical protein